MSLKSLEEQIKEIICSTSNQNKEAQIFYGKNANQKALVFEIVELRKFLENAPTVWLNNADLKKLFPTKFELGIYLENLKECFYPQILLPFTDLARFI